MSSVIGAIGHALALAGSMTWEILWALILGFALSAVVQAVVRKSTIVGLLGDDRPRTLAVAAGLGAASSSCSYAAVALARSLFRKGANFTAAMAFEIASTNLVVELGIILALLMGWQFTAAEFVGGPLMIIVVAVLFRLFVRSRTDRRRSRAGRPRARRVDGRPRRDGHVRTRRRLLLAAAVFQERLHLGVARVRHGMGRDSARPHHRVVDRRRDRRVGAGLGSGETFFITDHPTLAALWGPIVGPIVAIASFVCSIGNVPLAAVLWNGGISFGGVVAFIFADLLILPILNIYRKYYGTRMMFVLLGTFYAAMVIAGYLVELLFGAAGLIPTHRNAMVMQAGISWNYTTWLNIAFLVVAAVLVIRFISTGGIPMLQMMGGAPDAEHTPACHEPAEGHRVEDQGHHHDQRGSEHDQTVEQAHHHRDHG